MFSGAVYGCAEDRQSTTADEEIVTLVVLCVRVLQCCREYIRVVGP
ncbi:hypothetical protein OG799_18305 [Micromonospora sp. NBC_00898]|nr:hypothetical protein OG799_18305 [Micromonospora sp. NBC_00898]